MKKSEHISTVRRARLKDIAERAGITMTSVSRALKGCSNISQATQERVRQIALDMGYISNPHAQSLRNGHFPVIAIVYDNFKNPFYSIVTGMIDAYIRERNYRSMVFNEFNQDARLGLAAAQEITAFNLSGVITFLVPTQEAIELFKRHSVPLIIIGRDGSEMNIDSVSSNDFQGGYLAGKELLKTGRRHFLYIGAYENLPINRNRYQGFLKALSEENINPIAKFNNENIAADALVEAAFIEDTHIDGIFCFNDLMAFEVVNYLMEHKRRIPKETAVIGYDNLQRYINYPFRLTTIDADMQTTAKLVVDSIFMQLKDPSRQPVNQVVDVSIMIGKTS
ncbi:MAG TPA: LacI family DNA-binding transcriptional regulator [Bacilli bacterium]|nr:LacI family DNA-binding transcriptional regulator [Bacilli bacterium]